MELDISFYFEGNTFSIEIDMRIKISFLKVHGSSGTVPLHHQKIISAFMDEIIRELPVTSDFYNFSSLKGTSKVQSGQIRFLSSKVSLVVSTSQWVYGRLGKKNLRQKIGEFAKLTLVPKSMISSLIRNSNPQMKYVCISPMIPQQPFPDGWVVLFLNRWIQEATSFQIFLWCRSGLHGKKPDSRKNKSAACGNLKSFLILDTFRKFLRHTKVCTVLKNNNNQTMYGYLLPFTLHAHPQVQKFIWECGIEKLHHPGIWNGGCCWRTFKWNAFGRIIFARRISFKFVTFAIFLYCISSTYHHHDCI